MKKEYAAGSVMLSQEQADVIAKAINKFRDAHGISLSRSQMLAWLAFLYIKGELK